MDSSRKIDVGYKSWGVIVFALTFLTSQAGCATKSLQGLDENVLSRLGKVGVVSAQFLPEMVLDLPPAGPLERTGRGAIVGAKWGAVGGAIPLGATGGPGGICAAPPAAIYCLALVGAGATIGGVSGIAYGAFTGEPPEKVQYAQQALRQALTNLRIQENLREHVVNQAQTKTTYTFTAFPKLGPASKDEALSYERLGGEGIDAVLEIQVLALGVKETELAMTPPLSMFMEVKARLIGLADNIVLFDKKFDYETDPHPYVDWVAEDARLFHEAINLAYRILAGDIVWATLIRPKLKF